MPLSGQHNQTDGSPIDESKKKLKGFKIQAWCETLLADTKDTGLFMELFAGFDDSPKNAQRS